MIGGRKMEEKLPLVVTIDRQLGSGGAYLGRRIAKELNLSYLDREIMSKAAEKLKVLEEDLECYDEKVMPVWQSIIQSFAYCNVDAYNPPTINAYNIREIYEAEETIILAVAHKKPCIIIGRGASYILKDRPKHISIFLHADLKFRNKRVRELYNLSEKEATKLIEDNDKDRARYFNSISGKNITDACQYHLCIDTSEVGLKEAEAIILSYINLKYGNDIV